MNYYFLILWFAVILIGVIAKQFLRNKTAIYNLGFIVGLLASIVLTMANQK